MMTASKCWCRACPPLVSALLKCDGRTIAAGCPSVPFAPATIGRARLRNSMPWPTPTPGPMKSRPSTSTLFPPGSLADADPRRTREMFRKRLDRAGFKGAIVVGGIEVAWQEK